MRSSSNCEEVHVAKVRHGEGDCGDQVFKVSLSTGKCSTVFPAAVPGCLRVVMHRASKAWICSTGFEGTHWDFADDSSSARTQNVRAVRCTQTL
jgi:hypothetical protein